MKLREGPAVKSRLIRILVVSYLACTVLVIATPMWLTLITAFKSTDEVYANYFVLPETLDFSNFAYVVKAKGFFTYFGNSAVVTVCSLALINLVTPLTAYVIAKNYEKRLYRVIYYYFMIPFFIPFNVIVFPLTKLLYSVNLMNRAGLILCYVALSIPENVFLYLAYFCITSKRLYEAALLDHCTPLRYFIRILLPSCKKILLTVNILNLVWIWNDYYMPLMVLNADEALWTLPIFIYRYKSRYGSYANYASAAYYLAIIPLLIVYLVFNRQIIGGVSLRGDVSRLGEK